MHPRTVLALSIFLSKTLKACKTQRAAVMALVVAMAGMMLPAISNKVSIHNLKKSNENPRLMSNFDLRSIPKTMDRRFALAATKSRISSSSLSNSSTRSSFWAEKFVAVWQTRWLKRRRLMLIRRVSLTKHHVRLPVRKNRHILRECPGLLILLSNPITVLLRVFKAHIKVERCWGFSVFPHVLHPAQSIDIRLEDLFKYPLVEAWVSHRITNAFQGHCFLLQACDFRCVVTIRKGK